MISAFMTSEKPRIAFSGVRSSWLMVARNWDLELLAASARRRASSEIAFSSSRAAISRSFWARNFNRSTAVWFNPFANQMK